MSKNTVKAPAKKAPAKKSSALPEMPAKFADMLSANAKDRDRAHGNAKALWEGACKEVSAIIAAGAMLVNKGRDAWGCSDYTRCRFIHEALFAGAFDYASGKMLPVPIARTSAEIHAFTCAAQVMTGIETGESITTPSATGSHLSSLQSKYFDGSIQQGCTRGDEKSSIQGTGNGFVMRSHFARDYREAKGLRGELPAVKSAKK